FISSLSAALSQTVNSPVPSLTSLSSTSATEGAASLTLTLTGTGFVPNSQVRWNGTALTTTFVSGTLLQAAVPVGNLANANVFSITVFNPGPGGGITAAQSFSVVDAPITATGSTIVAAQGTAFAGTVAIITDSNTAGAASEF